MVTAPVVAIASQLAGESVQVSCERNARFSDASRAYTVWQANDGTIVFDPVIHLSASTCNELNRLVVRDTRSSAGQTQFVTNGGAIIDLAGGGAVHLLLHEALHLREKSTDEARVECDASRNAWSAVALFHLAAWRDQQILRGMAVAHAGSAPSYLKDC